jgi:SAM-dependent methyltransferase
MVPERSLAKIELSTGLAALLLAAAALAATPMPAGAPPTEPASQAAAAPHAAEPSACEAGYTPKSGQPGKDAMWIPTPEPLVSRMIELAGVKPSDVVYDLGSGDGRIVIAAAKLGARAVGVEYNPKLVELSRCLIAAAGLTGKARIIQGDLFQTSFQDATVVTLFLRPDVDQRLRPKLLALRPGTRIVSHSYLMGDWQPDQRVITPRGMIYLWIVPAHVDGAWTFRSRHGSDHFTVTFVQTYQRLVGLLGDGTLVTDPQLHGTQVAFTFGDGDGLTRVTGSVDGERIDAQVSRNGHKVAYVGARS